MEYWEYDGKPILNIEGWAAVRKESMVKVRMIKKMPSFASGQMIEEISECWMPESFYNSMRFNNHFEKIDEREPFQKEPTCTK